MLASALTSTLFWLIRVALETVSRGKEQNFIFNYGTFAKVTPGALQNKYLACHV